MESITPNPFIIPGQFYPPMSQHEHYLVYQEKVSYPCDICKKFTVSGSYYICNKCKFYVCIDCYKPALNKKKEPEIQANINNNQIYPSKNLDPHDLTYKENRNYYCNVCKKNFNKQPSYWCDKCNFDACLMCYNNTEQFGKSNIQYVYEEGYPSKGLHKHNLNFIESLRFRCKVCKKHYVNQPTYRCKMCNFDACLICYNNKE